MTSNTSSSITIVGAGLAGSLLACLFGRTGRTVDIYERLPDPRVYEPTLGNSINLALSMRGIEALRVAGIERKVLTKAVPMLGREIHFRNGGRRFQPYGIHADDAIYSISRATVSRSLIEAAAEYASVTQHFESPCAALDVDSSILTVTRPQGEGSRTVPYDLLIGADGASSLVRTVLEQRGMLRVCFEPLHYGFGEFRIPPDANGDFQLNPQALHIWPRRNMLLIALPNIDGSFTGTLFRPLADDLTRGPTRIERFVASEFPDLPDCQELLMECFLREPIARLATVRCFPWHWTNRVILLGDACHAVLPFLGQGMNAAFEDCVHLSRQLNDGDVRESILIAYEEARKPHTDALADMSLANFQEMCATIRSPAFHAWKWLERLLHRLLGRWYLPLYTMIAFTCIPYADARRRARWQMFAVVAFACSAVLATVWFFFRFRF